MYSSLVLAALLAAFVASAVICEPLWLVPFTSHSSAKTYGLYLTAPEGCTFVRHRLGGAGLRDQTHLLQARQGRVVRLGAGFAPGLHVVRIDVVGCPRALVLVRPVVLRKASPDHGARALTYIKAHALGEGQG